MSESTKAQFCIDKMTFFSKILILKNTKTNERWQ